MEISKTQGRPKRPEWVIWSKLDLDKPNWFDLYYVCVLKSNGQLGDPTFGTIDPSLAVQVRNWLNKHEPPECPHLETFTLERRSLGGNRADLEMCNMCGKTVSPRGIRV